MVRAMVLGHDTEAMGAMIRGDVTGPWYGGGGGMEM